MTTPPLNLTSVYPQTPSMHVNTTPIIVTIAQNLRQMQTYSMILIDLLVYDWSAADYGSINEHLDCVDWHVLFAYSPDTETIWANLNQSSGQ